MSFAGDVFNTWVFLSFLLMKSGLKLKDNAGNDVTLTCITVGLRLNVNVIQRVFSVVVKLVGTL